MKITAITAALAATVAASGAVGIGAPIAFAETSTQTIGSQGKLVNGDVVQAWTITRSEAQHGRHPPSGKRHAVGSDRNRSSHPGFCDADRFEPQRPCPERPDVPGPVRGRDCPGRQPGHPRTGAGDHRKGVLRRHRRHARQRRVQRRRPGSARVGAAATVGPAVRHRHPDRRRTTRLRARRPPRLRPPDTRASACCRRINGRPDPHRPPRPDACPRGQPGHTAARRQRGTPLPAGSQGTPLAPGARSRRP